jgi:hypothetical protein
MKRLLVLLIVSSSALIELGIGCCLLAADEPKERVQVSKTERLDFPAGGTLRLKNSFGALMVEGWDRPNVEITTIKSSKDPYDAREREKAANQLDRVRVAAERHGDEMVITTDFPRHRPFPFPNPVGGATDVNLEYRIKAPTTARLIVDHGVGEVNVDNLTGNMDLRLLQGEIMLRLTGDAKYSINAKSDFGSVTSDFPGEQKHGRLWFPAHSLLNEDSRSERRLNLKVGWGDIIILKTRVPKPPEPLSSAPERDNP